VAGCVLITSIKGGHESGGKRKACPPESFVRRREVLAYDLFLLIEEQQALRGQRGDKEDEDEPKRVEVVAIDE
jgi:hypothetical protein